MSNDEAIARLTEDGTPLGSYFLLGAGRHKLVAFWHPENGVMACAIDDGDISRADKRVLKKRKVREFRSAGDVHQVARQERWPNWENFRNA